MRVFVAGGSGAVGRPLVRLLAARGHVVVATTRSVAKAKLLRAAGATASNQRARRELGWEPLWRSWREGFRRTAQLGPKEHDARP